LWGHVTECGDMWLIVGTCDWLWGHVTDCGDMWLSVGTCDW
jgi:hypothetical protein